MEYKVTASIVAFKNKQSVIQKAINSFLNTKVLLKLYIIDNSPTDELKVLAIDNRVEYIHNPSNPGFGSSHNTAIMKSISCGSVYHFIVNPDIYFVGDIISPMIHYLSNDSSIGMMMPEILNEDGTVQNLPKLLPSPLSILLRKLKKPNRIYQKFINNYELRFVPQKIIYNVPILSGCFTLFSTEAIKDIGGYDDNYFMYFEDWDLSRRIHVKYKTIYFPHVSVYHGYDSGANKSYKLFKIFVNSAIVYFNKWGWFFDKKRKEINNKTLSQFK